MTATDIYHVLQKRFPTVMRGVHPRNMGKILIKIGAKRTHTKQGNLYEVVKAMKAGENPLLSPKQRMNQSFACA